MDQYGAHILASIRRTEFTADAVAARRAAASREQSPVQPRQAEVRRRFRARRPATT
jgi:hypothetical protein